MLKCKIKRLCDLNADDLLALAKARGYDIPPIELQRPSFLKYNNLGEAIHVYDYPDYNGELVEGRCFVWCTLEEGGTAHIMFDF